MCLLELSTIKASDPQEHPPGPRVRRHQSFVPVSSFTLELLKYRMLGGKKSSDLLQYLPVAVSDPHWDGIQIGKAYPSTWRHSTCEARTKPTLMVFSSIKQNKAESWQKKRYQSLQPERNWSILNSGTLSGTA